MVTIQKLRLSDAATLLTYSKETFYEFFAHLNSVANMEVYSSVAFTDESILNQLSNPGSEFYFALIDGNIAGYLKLNFNNAQNEFRDKNAMEIERIYVSGKYKGKRIGGQLLNFAMDTAVNKQLNFVWLGVWEHNYKALGFYKHNGFKEFGSHKFLLGDDSQVDLLMKKDI